MRNWPWSPMCPPYLYPGCRLCLDGRPTRFWYGIRVNILYNQFRHIFPRSTIHYTRKNASKCCRGRRSTSPTMPYQEPYGKITPGTSMYVIFEVGDMCWGVSRQAEPFSKSQNFVIDSFWVGIYYVPPY